jgi:hypothetical protein
MAGTDNLVPFKEGDDPRRNTSGRPLGSKNWSTVVQDLLEDEELAPKMLTKQPEYFNLLKRKDGAHLIVTAMMGRAMSGDTKAADWLRKTGFGDKIDLNLSGKVEGLTNEQLAAIITAGARATDEGGDRTSQTPLPPA